MPPAAIFLSTAKEIWKRTPPKTKGFWISLVRLQPRYKKVPQGIACTSFPAAAPAYRAETFFSRTVQGKCFTPHIILYSAARRAAPIYHSPPENATRSRVPRLNAPNGHTPPTLISPCLRSRTPQGLASRRPASAHLRIPTHSRLSLRRGRRPRRPGFRSSIAGCTRVLHVCLRREYFALRRGILLPTAAKGCRSAAKNQRFLDFLLSDCNRGTKRFRTESPALLSPLPLLRAAG